METVKVDKERFEAAVKKAGYPSNRDLSRGMGYGPAWIYQHLMRGERIPKIAATYLEVRHGIGYDVQAGSEEGGAHPYNGGI